MRICLRATAFKMISIKELMRPELNSRPTNDDEIEERGLYPAFVLHIGESKLLKSHPTPYYEGALYSLFLGIECLLNDLFCLLRNAQGINQTHLREFKKLVTDNNKAKSFPGQFNPKNFGHNLKLKAYFLQIQITELNSSDNFNSFLKNLPEKDTWVQKRYSAKVSPSSKKLLDELSNSLSELSQNELSNLITKGDI